MMTVNSDVKRQWCWCCASEFTILRTKTPHTLSHLFSYFLFLTQS